MASPMLRRSANAVIEYCSLIKWQPSVVVMVGVGVHCEDAQALKEAWPKSSMIGYEPNLGTFEAVRGVFNGVLYNAAISNQNGKAVLHYKRNWKDGSSLYPRNQEKDVDVEDEVECRTLDSEFASRMIRRCDNRGALLWLDCEGSEMSAIIGGASYIRSQVGVINVEMTGKPRGVGWGSSNAVHSSLHSMGLKRSWVHSIRTPIGQYDAVYVHSSVYKPEFSCCPCSSGCDNG